MKKYLLGVFLLLLCGYSSVLAEGCFHDAIQVVDEPGEIIQGVRFRNLACMLGSDVITTLKAGTKVKIIGKTAWTKVALADGRIGRVGNNFIKTISDATGTPAFPSNHQVDSYCDTTNTSRCPYPVGANEVPTFYTKDTDDVPSTPTTTTTTSTVANPALDALLESLYASLERKYGDDQTKKQQAVDGIVTALTSLKSRMPKLASAISYLIQKLSFYN